MVIASDSVFIDTNVIIYANLRQSEFYPYAMKWLEKLQKNGNNLWISRQVLREYLSAMTRQTEFTESMQAYGIRHLLTHNVSDFERFSDVITILPLVSS